MSGFEANQRHVKYGHHRNEAPRRHHGLHRRDLLAKRRRASASGSVLERGRIRVRRFHGWRLSPRPLLSLALRLKLPGNAPRQSHRRRRWPLWASRFDRRRRRHEGPCKRVTTRLVATAIRGSAPSTAASGWPKCQRQAAWTGNFRRPLSSSFRRRKEERAKQRPRLTPINLGRTRRRPR